MGKLSFSGCVWKDECRMKVGIHRFHYMVTLTSLCDIGIDKPALQSDSTEITKKTLMQDFSYSLCQHQQSTKIFIITVCSVCAETHMYP